MKYKCVVGINFLYFYIIDFVVCLDLIFIFDILFFFRNFLFDCVIFFWLMVVILMFINKWNDFKLIFDVFEDFVYFFWIFFYYFIF